MANDEYSYNRLLVWLMRLFSLALFQSAWPPCRKCLRSSFAWIRETPHAGLQRAPVAGTKPPLLLVEWTWRSWDALGHPARHWRRPVVPSQVWWVLAISGAQHLPAWLQASKRNLGHFWRQTIACAHCHALQSAWKRRRPILSSSSTCWDRSKSPLTISKK